MNTCLRIGTSFLVVTLLAAASHADWPQWRGPNGNAVVPDGEYPIDLGDEKNLLWKIQLPGPGSSTPIVLEGEVYLTCEVEGLDTLCRYNSAGELQWKKSFGPARAAKHRLATGANSSPTTDGQSLFAYFKSGLLVATSREGKELWRRNLQKEFGKDTLWWDLGTSPVVTPAGLLVAVMQEDNNSYLVTFDRSTGEVVWKKPRAMGAPGESSQSYTTPALVEMPSGPAVVVWGADHLTAHDAMTGEELFRCDGFNDQGNTHWRVIASATLANSVAIVPYGRGEFVAAVRLEGSGDITSTNRIWTQSGVGSDVPCPAVKEGKVYVLGDRGTVTCLDFETGEPLWSGQLPKSKNKFFSSPLLAGDKMYCFREEGVGFTARVEGGYELLATYDLGEEVVTQTLPINGNQLLVRTREHLYLFGK